MTTSPAPTAWSVLRLAGPLALGSVLDGLLNVIDTAVVGHVGKAAQAGTGLGSLYSLVVVSILVAVGLGTQVPAALAVGEGDERKRRDALRAGVTWTLAVGVPASLGFAAAAGPLLTRIASDPEVGRQAASFAVWRCALVPFSMLLASLRGYVNAVGRPSVYVPSMVVSLVVNGTLAPVLALAAGWGVAGAAIATGLGQLAGCLSLALPGSRGYLTGIGVGTSRAALAALARVAIPAGLSMGLLALGFLVFLALLERLGAAELAAATILVNLLSIAFLLASGVGTAASALVGRLVGEGDWARARLAGQAGARASLLLGAAAAVPMALGAPFVRLLSNDTYVAERAATLARATAIVLPLDAVGIALCTCLFAAKDNRAPAAAVVAGHWLVFLPATWFALHRGGGLGTAMALYGGYRVLLAAFMAVRFERVTTRCSGGVLP